MLDFGRLPGWATVWGLARAVMGLREARKVLSVRGIWELDGFCRGVALAALLSSLPCAVQAQAIPQQDLDQIQRQQDEIQRKQEDLNRQFEEDLKQKRRQPPAEVLPEKPVLPALPEGKECFDIDRIELKGVTLLSESDVKELVAPFEGRCLKLGEVNELLRAITNLYVEKGYVTTRPFVPEQDINDRVFEIIVVEGYIEGINIKDQPDHVQRQLATAFPGLVGGKLNLRDIEQGLDQMNRLPSNNAKMKLEPGSKQGATKVVVENPAEKFWRIKTGFDNTGSASTGEHKGNLTGEADNLLDLNDSWTLSWSRDLFGTRGKRESESVNGYFSIPYGYWTFTATGSWFEYLSTVNSTSASYTSSGNSRSLKFDLERVIHRDADGKTWAGASLKRYKSRNYIDHSLLSASSYDLTVLTGALHHSRRLLGGVLGINADYSRGITGLNAKRDFDLNSDNAHAQFDKVTANLSYYKPFKAGAMDLAWSFYANGQYSPDTLYSAEKTTVGGKSSVRGFKENTLSGDKAGYIRNEIIGTLPQTGYDKIDWLIGILKPFVAYDFGGVRHDDKDTNEKGYLSGYAIGLRNSGGKLSFDVTYARPHSAPGFIPKRHHEVYFSLSLNI